MKDGRKNVVNEKKVQLVTFPHFKARKQIIQDIKVKDEFPVR